MMIRNAINLTLDCHLLNKIDLNILHAWKVHHQFLNQNIWDIGQQIYDSDDELIVTFSFNRIYQKLSIHWMHNIAYSKLGA